MSTENYKERAIREQNEIAENPDTPPNPQNTLSNGSIDDPNKFNSIEEYDRAILSGRDWRLHTVDLVDENSGEVFSLSRVPITVEWATCPRDHPLKNGDFVWFVKKEIEKGLIEKRCKFFWHLAPNRNSFEWKIREKWFKRNIRGR